jgi:ketosteroid isomerase-like protein
LQDAKDDESAIRGLLTAEGQFVVSQDIEALMKLWAENAKVMDAKNTPNDANDDQLWAGKDAIRHRYVRIVFPGAPKEVDHNDEQITINGDTAQVQSTTAIGSEVAKAGDHWEMVRQGGCWYLESLTFNLEPAP